MLHCSEASGAPAADDAFAAGMGMGIVTGAARPVRLATPVNAAAARLFPGRTSLSPPCEGRLGRHHRHRIQ